MILMAVSGLILGAALGCALVMIQARILLKSYANLAAAQADSSISEAHKILTNLKSSPYGVCSDEEIAYLRGLVFQSQFVKDAGRMEGGRVQCSATGGPVASFSGLGRSAIRLQDGTKSASASIAHAQVAADKTLLELVGDYVMYASALPVAPGPLLMHGSTTLKGAETTAQFRAGDLKTINRFTDASGRLGQTLYATRCAAQGSSCSTVFTSLRAAFLNQLDTIASSAFAGGLAGILIGLAFSFRYQRTRELKQQLRRAAEGDELSVAYQPIVDLETRQIVGAEALARWKDEEGNEVKPDIFIKIAEEFGFVGAITRTVLKRTLQDFAATLRERPDFRISINVAGADLSDPEFVPMLQDSLKRARVKPRNIAIELTERSAADNEAAIETIRTLRDLGHSIHIDDFGTGYSNLDKLLCLFADTIKIDKAFTGGIGTESASAAILPQILAMAESLNLEVVVEGVETFRQADYFNPGHQKIYAQGWLYGRPVTAMEFLALLADEQTVLTSSEEVAAFTTRPGALRIVSQQTA